jgi:hypothetical protein
MHIRGETSDERPPVRLDRQLVVMAPSTGAFAPREAWTPFRWETP